jgi:hypothetical protein
MNHRITRSTATSLLACGLAALVPAVAQAQAAADKWQWEVGIYGWLPAIGGTTAFPSNGNAGPSIDVTSQDVINALKMTFMGQIEARKGQWGLWSDVVYADLGGSKNGSRSFTVDHQPVNVDANFQLDVKSTVWTAAGLYNLASTPENTTDLLFGTRLLDLKQKLSWAVSSSIAQLPGRAGVADAGLTNWDVIVGVKGRYYVGDERKWFLPYYVDMGVGESKFTWQINAGVGYRFDWGSVFATYRYLDYQFKSGNPVQTLTLNGGLVGVAFQF